MQTERTNRRSDQVSASLHERLRRGARRLTGARREVLRVMELESRPLTNKEIFQALPKGCCDLATVYRCIQLLENLGLVKKFFLGDGPARYVLISEGDMCHRHHLVCTRCRMIVDIGECIVRELEDRVVERSRFKAVTHRLEFFGICPTCQ